MSTTEKETKKAAELLPPSASGNLFSLSELDNFFDDFLLRKWPRLLDWNFPAGFEKAVPKVDILDRDTEIEVQAALPGVAKDSLDVTINNQTITIRAAMRRESNAGDGQYFRREISRGEFQRSIPLPVNVDGDNAKASFKDGMLTVIIPKTARSQRKTIEITD